MAEKWNIEIDFINHDFFIATVNIQTYGPYNSEQSPLFIMLEIPLLIVKYLVPIVRIERINWVHISVHKIGTSNAFRITLTVLCNSQLKCV